MRIPLSPIDIDTAREWAMGLPDALKVVKYSSEKIMKNYELESEDMAFDDSSSMDLLGDSMSEFDLCNSMLEPEPVVPSIDRSLVDLFLEYRRRVGRRGGSSKLTN